MFVWLTGSPTHPPIYLTFRSSRAFIIWTISLAIFTDIFVYAIVVPVLPFALTSRAGIDPSQVQTWVSIFLAVYGAALLAAAPVFGWLADRSASRRAPLMGGLLALGGSTAMLAAGSGIGVLVAGRVLQGVSAAVVWVVGLALLVDTVGPDQAGQTMGYVGIAMNLGILLAPLLGGVVFEQAGYYAVFAMAFGLIGVDVVLRVVMVEKKVARRWLSEEEAYGGNGKGERGIEAEGQAKVEGEREAEGAGGQQATPIAVEEKADPSPPINTTDNATVEQPSAQPNLKARLAARLPPVFHLLASGRLLNALWAVLIQATLLTSFDALLPLFVRDTFRWNATGAGLVFLPLVLGSFFGPIVGALSDRHGPRWYATSGFLLGTPFLILLRLVDHNDLKQKVLLCALLALIGLSLTLMLTPVMAEITYAVEAKGRMRPEGYFGPHGAYAQAYSLFNMAWAAGSLVGPLLGGLVRQTKGWGATTLILGCVSAATALPTAIWTGGGLVELWKGRRARRAQGVGEGEEVGDGGVRS